MQRLLLTDRAWRRLRDMRQVRQKRDHVGKSGRKAFRGLDGTFRQVFRPNAETAGVRSAASLPDEIQLRMVRSVTPAESAASRAVSMPVIAGSLPREVGNMPRWALRR